MVVYDVPTYPQLCEMSIVISEMEVETFVYYQKAADLLARKDLPDTLLGELCDYVHKIGDEWNRVYHLKSDVKNVLWNLRFYPTLPQFDD